MEVDRHSVKKKKKKWDISVYQAQSKSNLSVYAYCSRCKDGCCAENTIWTTTRLLAVVWKVITIIITNFGIICTAKKQKLARNEACEKGNKDEDIAKKCGNGEKSLQRYDEGCYIGRL